MGPAREGHAGKPAVHPPLDKNEVSIQTESVCPASKILRLISSCAPIQIADWTSRFHTLTSGVHNVR